jgi:hypothetical protein
MLKKKKKRSSKNYSFHLVRAMIAFVGVTMLSWAVWKLLDHYFSPESSFINAVVAGVIAVAVLAVDHFRLREIE